MNAVVGALRVVLGANTAQYEAGMRRAGRTARRTGGEINQALLTAQRTAVGAFRGIAAAAGVVGIGAAAREYLRFVDTAKQIEAQLRLATREMGNFGQAQEDVRRIAQATRTGLEETASLYATFQRNSRELGITQEQAARATETVSKAFQISGASAAEAAGGLRQFLQGVQSGTLRGEELNSVLENAPRLARLLADSLGVTIGQLRAMGQEGQLTGDRLINALTNRRFTEGIDAEFRELPVTFEQAMTGVNNAAIVAFGAFDRGGEFSNALIDFMGTGQMSFEEIEASAFRTGEQIRSIMAGLNNVFDPMGQGAANVFDFIEQQARGLRDAISDIMHTLQAVANTYVDVANFVDNAGHISNPGLFAPGTRQRATFADRFDASGLARPWSPGDGFTTAQRLGPVQVARPSLRGSASGGNKRRGRRGPSAETLARRAEAERIRHLRDDESFASEMAAINQDLLAARQATAVAAEIVAAFEVQQIEAARDRTNLGYQADAEQARDRRDLAQARALQLIEANNAVAAERINAVQLREQERIRQEQVDIAATDLENALDLEQSQAALAETSRERRASALRILDYQKQLERLELENILASRDATEAQREIARRRLELLDSIYRGREQDAMNSTRSPLGDFMNDLPTTADKLNDALENVAANGLRAIEDGLVSIIDGTKSVADAFADMAKSIISDLVRIAIQRAVIAPLANALFPGGKVPGFDSGGSFSIGGMPGVDRNMLSLNGVPLARVSRGERVGVGRGGGENVTINQNIRFEGVAVTQEEFVRGLAITKQATIAGIRDLNRRR